MLLRLAVLIAASLAFLSLSAYSQTSPEQKKLPQQLEGEVGEHAKVLPLILKMSTCGLI